MGKKNQSGSRKKSSAEKYHKRRMSERANREAKNERRVQIEAEFSQRNFARRDAPLVCPLCNQPITEEDQGRNVHQVTIDHKNVQVHRTCPGDTE